MSSYFFISLYFFVVVLTAIGTVGSTLSERFGSCGNPSLTYKIHSYSSLVKMSLSSQCEDGCCFMLSSMQQAYVKAIISTFILIYNAISTSGGTYGELPYRLIFKGFCWYWSYSSSNLVYLKDPFCGAKKNKKMCMHTHTLSSQRTIPSALRQ